MPDAEVGFLFRALLGIGALLLAWLARGPRLRYAGLIPLAVLVITGHARWVFAAAAVALLGPSVLALDGAPAPRRSMRTLAAGLVALGALTFAWLLPLLPAVTRLFAPVLGPGRYGSPARLWVALAVAAPLAALLARGPGVLTRAGRPLLARRVEVALVLSLAALVLAWLGAALGTLPPFVALGPRAALLAGAIAAAGWLFAIAGLRRRPCAPASSGEE